MSEPTTTLVSIGHVLTEVEADAFCDAMRAIKDATGYRFGYGWHLEGDLYEIHVRLPKRDMAADELFSLADELGLSDLDDNPDEPLDLYGPDDYSDLWGEV